MQGLKKKTKGFTLIEAIIALGILSLLAVFLLPSLGSVIKNANKNKDTSRIIYALESALEIEKSLDSADTSHPQNHTINGIEVYITREAYSDNLEKITATSGTYELSVLEVIDEKAWFYSN